VWTFCRQGGRGSQFFCDFVWMAPKWLYQGHSDIILHWDANLLVINCNKNVAQHVKVSVIKNKIE